LPRLRLGQVDYLNCLPVYHALEEGLLEGDFVLVKGTPARLNKLFLQGYLDVTPISSIEYARNVDKCLILPNMSVSADGKVESILFFSHLPPTELEGKKVCVTTSSATSVALLRILFEHYYHVEVEIQPTPPHLETMLAGADGALLIGDDAMQARYALHDKNIIVTDLGESWKQFTGEKMVYAVWVVSSAVANANPETVNQIANLLYQSKMIGLSRRNELVDKAHARTHLPRGLLDNYFDTIHHGLGEDERRALLTFFDYAYKSGIIEERVKLKIWGEL